MMHIFLFIFSSSLISLVCSYKMIAAHNIPHWKQLYNEGKKHLINLLMGPGSDHIYQSFGIMINAYEPRTEQSLKRKREDDDYNNNQLMLNILVFPINNAISNYFQGITLENDCLEHPDVLRLSLACKGVWDIAKNYINKRYTFRVPFAHFMDKYRPHKLKELTSVIGISSSVTEIAFFFSFNAPVTNLPSSITHITFSKFFNNNIDCLPPSITHITFRKRFNSPIQSLPKYLQYIKFGSEFNLPVDFTSSSLTHLSFGRRWNQPAALLPQHLTFLKLGDAFDQPSIDLLPQSLTQLIFGESFNQPVTSLPRSLTCLTFGDRFNQSVDSLPPSLICLTFGYEFEQSIDCLPQSLCKLHFHSHSLEQSLANLPSITHLTLHLNEQPTSTSLPNSITYLTTSHANGFTHLPEALVKLVLCGDDTLLSPHPDLIIETIDSGCILSCKCTKHSKEFEI